MGFVHLHTHSEYSALDGLSTVDEIVAEVKRLGQDAVAVTDHGNCSGHPAMYKACKEAGVRPILGIEAYLVHDRLERPEKVEILDDEGNLDKEATNLRFKAEQSRIRKYYHLVLYAKNEVGLRNLWAMSTESYKDGHYFKPRMDWDTLRRHSEGIIASTACLSGPLCRPFLDGNKGLAVQNLSKLVEIFGDDLYLEIMPNDMADQKAVNEYLVSLSQQLGLPLVATVDSHYPTKEDFHAHQTWIAVQTSGDVGDDRDLFDGDLGLYLKSEQEVREELAYLGEEAVEQAIQNTVRIAEQCDVSLAADPEPPVYLASVEDDNQRVHDLCMANWSKLRADSVTQDQYQQRFAYEFDLLSRKKFFGYYLMVSEYCQWAKDHGILVGPGRGSGAASIIAYLLGITEVDPIDADLPFERFMTEGRTSLPDFDVDFPASKKAEMLGHLIDRYGADFVISIGTHLRLKSKGIVRDVSKAIRSVMLADIPEHDEERRKLRNAEIESDIDAVSKIVHEAEAGTAGLGLPWDELWDLYGDVLNPYREKYPEVFGMCDLLVRRLKSYGKHAAGVVISTDKRLTDWLPLRRGDDPEAQLISQFDMVALEEMGLVKFDILTIRNLDTIQQTIDMIRRERGIDVNIYDWKDEYKDPQIWDTLDDAQNLGVFQIETAPGIQLTKRMKPRTLDELCDMITLVRPGPMRAGLTDAYLRRRAGHEEVSFPDPRMELTLGKTWGAMIYQEQIMRACIDLAGYSSDEADKVRKILGKKKVDQVSAAGQDFVIRAVEWGEMDFKVAGDLWEQMAEFAKYSFGKAHAYSYAMLSAWTLWLKTHYPVEYLTACMSTVDKDRVPEFIKEARRMGIKVLPPDINESGKGFRAGKLVIRYGLDAIHGVGEAAVAAVTEGQPYKDYLDYTLRKGSKANAGVTMHLARVGAFDSIESNRAGLITMLQEDKDGTSGVCVFKDYSADNDLDCGFDWSSEPRPVNKRTLKLLPAKPPPKRCTKGCRQYQAPPPLDLSSVPPLTLDQIMANELELLGMYLSATPFDKLDDEDRTELREEAELMMNGQNRAYKIAAIVQSVKKTRTRATQDEMAIVTLETEFDTIRAAIFPSLWIDIHRDVVKGRMCLTIVDKNDRGYSIKALVNV